MAFDFPAAPTENQIYSPAGGPTYVFKGGVWLMNYVPAMGDSPSDGYLYGRQSATWQKALKATDIMRRNRVVNPAFQISQENGSTLLTVSGSYGADQWYYYYAAGGGSLQRVAAVTPNGSPNRLRLIITTGAAVPATSFLAFVQNIEGTRVADFRWGSAAAKQIIMRFGFKAPAGTYCITLRNQANNRSYIQLFTIAAGQANTDTEQTLIVPGDVTGTWTTDTSLGIQFWLTMAVGTTYQGVAGWQAGNILGTSAVTNGNATTGNTFELWDVGLYLDPDATGVAPKWEMPDEAQELRACMRYFYTGVPKMTGVCIATSAAVSRFGAPHPVVMRIAPTLALIAAVPIYNGATATTMNALSTNFSTTAVLETEGGAAAASTINGMWTSYQGSGGKLNVSARY